MQVKVAAQSLQGGTKHVLSAPRCSLLRPCAALTLFRLTYIMRVLQQYLLWFWLIEYVVEPDIMQTCTRHP